MTIGREDSNPRKKLMKNGDSQTHARHSVSQKDSCESAMTKKKKEMVVNSRNNRERALYREQP
jgi:hypothetical protein